MSAIFKRELRSYMNNIIGYAFVALILVFAGAFTVVNNVLLASTHFEQTMSLMPLVLIVAIPVLAMRSIAEEKRSRIDRLIYSLPIKLSSVVLGKYFAMLTVFTFACGIIAVYPLIFRMFGMTALSSAYVALLGFWLLGAALLALCLFLSSLTESQPVAALLGVGGSLILYVLDSVTRLVPGGALAEVLRGLGIFSRFSLMCSGVLDLRTVIFDISFTVLFLFLSWQMMERKRRR